MLLLLLPLPLLLRLLTVCGPYLFLVLLDRPVHLPQVGQLSGTGRVLLEVAHVGSVDDDVVPLLAAPLDPRAEPFPLLRPLLVRAHQDINLRGPESRARKGEGKARQRKSSQVKAGEIKSRQCEAGLVKAITKAKTIKKNAHQIKHKYVHITQEHNTKRMENKQQWIRREHRRHRTAQDRLRPLRFPSFFYYTK